MDPQSSGPWVPPCPVCGRALSTAPSAPCPACGLPAAGQAALVVGRIGATLAELSRDRDALLATLRAAAPHAPSPYAAAAPQPGPQPGPQPAPALVPPAAYAPVPPPPVQPVPAMPRRRRLSPQQVLLGVGALLLVAAAITFVAVAWTHLGVVFQAGVMLVVTGAACGVSAWTARRGLRATEEALAAAGAALLAVDLGGAHALGLFGLDTVSLRPYTAVSCAIVVAAALALGRLTRSTVVWPLVALLAVQPLPFLVLPSDVLSGPAGVAAALLLAGGDLVAVRALRSGLRAVALGLGGLAACTGVVGGLVTAAGSDPADSWTATALLLAAGAVAVVLTRTPRPALLPAPVLVAAAAAAVGALALAGSLHDSAAGPVIAGALGLGLLTAAVLVARFPVATTAAATGGAVLTAAAVGLLADDGRAGTLAVLVLCGVVPAALAAVRLPALRTAATATALLLPAAAILLGREADRLSATAAGLLLALTAATAFAVATARAGRGEEWSAAAAGAVAGLLAGITSSTVGAWGQVGLQLAVAGAAAAAYAIVARRRWTAVVAVADLVGASWIAIAGAGVQTPEAYTLPAALGLLAIAVPQLRARANSWAAEGAAVGVALVPSAFVVLAQPTALRLVLVAAAAATFTVIGTVAHRQAPFMVGAGVLLVVAVGRLAPYAPLLPRWLTLGTAGLVLLVLGATYERRRQQAREAVAWVGQMS